jgi:branched-chain amino acid transport system substrate-binding protein
MDSGVKRACAFLVLALLAIGVASLAACSGGNDGDQPAKTFKIGYSADLSAGYSSYDVPIRDGAQYAIDEINKAGGVAGMKLELIVKDNKNDRALAVETTQELIDDGIQYLIGTTSDQVVVCNRLAQDNEIPSDTGDGTAPNLVDDIGEWSFQYIMPDNLQGAAMAEYVAGELGYRTAFILRSPDVPYSNNLPQYFKDVFERLGGRTVGTSEYRLEAGDFSAQVSKIAATRPVPDMIYTPMFMPDTPVFLRQLRAAGVDIPVVTSDGNDTLDILTAGPADLNGMILTTFAFPKPGTPLYDFYAQYEQNTGKAPDTVIVANGYDIIYVVKAALEEADGRGGQALRDALASLSGVKLSTTNDYVMDPQTRRARREVCLLKMKGDVFTFVQSLPFPQYVPAPL